MDKLVKFNSQSTGRDRLIRLVQYTSKLIWAYLEKRCHDKDVVNKLKNLEYSLSTARKLYRFGRSLDTIYGALTSIHLEDPALRFTITLSKINMALYLLSDHVLWLGRIGLVNINKQNWSTISNKLWLYYLVMNLARDFYEIMRVVNDTYDDSHNDIQCLRSPVRSPTLSKFYIMFRVLALHKDVAVDLIKNGTDICLPLTQLGYLSLSPLKIGLLGVVSSLAGILPLLDPSYKLSPS